MMTFRIYISVIFAGLIFSSAPAAWAQRYYPGQREEMGAPAPQEPVLQPGQPCDMNPNQIKCKFMKWGVPAGGDPSSAAGGDASASACQQAVRSASSACSPQGIAAVQGAAAVGTSAATTIIVNNNQANQGLSNTCGGVGPVGKVAGTATGAAMIACVMAYHNCINTCVESGLEADPTGAMEQQCQMVYSNFRGSLPMGLTGLLRTMNEGGLCQQQASGGSGLNGPSLNAPTDPNVAGDGLGNQGYTGNPAGNTAAQLGPDAPTGSGGMPTGAGYPAGAGAPNTQAAAKDTIDKVGLGLSSGSGGTVGSVGTVGGGRGMGGIPNFNPNEIAGLFNGKDGERKPASIEATGITGANDLTNFQKVTRMMNKKRPVLKTGETL